MVGAIDTVTGDPGKRDTGLAGSLQHGQAELGLGGEGNLGGDVRLASAVCVVGPVDGQVQRAIDQRLAVASGIAEEHADLAVLDPARGAAVLPLHPG
jgi:chorismate mutase